MSLTQFGTIVLNLIQDYSTVTESQMPISDQLI